MGDIPKVIFICIGFPLKRDLTVGLIGIAVFDKPNEVFYKIPKKEEKYQQFYLLFQMNALMVHENRILFQLFTLQDNKGPQDHAIKVFRKKKFIYYHEHEDKIRKCYFCDMSFLKKKIPLEEGDFYLTPEGYRCFTEQYHLKRGYCCQSGCRHCPYGYNKKTNQQD